MDRIEQRCSSASLKNQQRARALGYGGPFAGPLQQGMPVRVRQAAGGRRHVWHDEPHERRLLTLYENAVRQMEPFDREIFLAHRVDGVPLREIARRNDLTIGQVEPTLIIFQTTSSANWNGWFRSSSMNLKMQPQLPLPMEEERPDRPDHPL